MNSAVIDANLAIYAVLPGAKHEKALELLERLVGDGVVLYVPRLWLSEVTTGIRKSAALEGISPESAILALKTALDLPVEVVSEDVALCIQAYGWAERLGHLAVYDSLYLALAERLNADFYTADRKLFSRCMEIGVGFVKIVE